MHVQPIKYWIRSKTQHLKWMGKGKSACGQCGGPHCRSTAIHDKRFNDGADLVCCYANSKYRLPDGAAAGFTTRLYGRQLARSAAWFHNGRYRNQVT